MSEKDETENRKAENKSILQNFGKSRISFLKNKNSLCPNLQSLIMSSCNLSKIPQIIFSLNHLIELNLSNNNLLSLPCEIGSLHNLLILSVSGNKLTILPDSVKFMHNLNYLDISCNNFYDVPCALHSGLGVLKILNLSFNKIKSFDNTPKCINSLRILVLSNNALTNLPKWVFYSLCQLKTLDIGGNCIFPCCPINDFCTARIFESLKFLNVENCNLSIKKIKFLSCFKNLEVLHMGNKINNVRNTQNYLSSLNIDTFRNLNILKCLYLQNVQMSALPLGFDCMKYLEVLDLSENLLTWLPDCLCDLIFLKILNLTSNQLFFLPNNINKLKHLKELHLANNNLDYLPKGIYNLNNLEYVDLYNNKLEEIDFAIFKKHKLKGIDFGLNCLKNYFLHLNNEGFKTQYESLKISLRLNFNYMSNRSDVQTVKAPDKDESFILYDCDCSDQSEFLSDTEDLSAVSPLVSDQGVLKEENWEEDVEVLKEEDLFNPNSKSPVNKEYPEIEIQASYQSADLRSAWRSAFPNNYCPAYNCIPSIRETFISNIQSSLQKKSVEGQFDSD